METSSFDEQIFGDFAGPISPLGAKQLTPGGHSIHVMLGMNPPNSSDMCNQRLPEVQSLLPGSPKLNHYKALDYISSKVDYNGKMASYSPSPPTSSQQPIHPPPKYDYLNGKIDHYGPPSHITKIDYTKPMDYNGKLEYDPQMHMYSQPPSLPQQSHQTQPSQSSMGSPSSGIDKKKTDDAMGSTTPTTTSSDATSTSKKNEKKKGDINGVKKKKTR